MESDRVRAALASLRPLARRQDCSRISRFVAAVRKYFSSCCRLLQRWRLFTKCLQEDIPDEYGIVLQVSRPQPPRL
jgi:hypothetical protein